MESGYTVDLLERKRRSVRLPVETRAPFRGAARARDSWIDWAEKEDKDEDDDRPLKSAPTSAAPSPIVVSTSPFRRSRPGSNRSSYTLEPAAGGATTRPVSSSASTPRHNPPATSKIHLRSYSPPSTTSKVDHQPTKTSLAPLSVSRSHSRSRTRSKSRGRERKGMLSSALEKANLAVELDKESNFDAAVRAYAEACDLLDRAIVRGGSETSERLRDIVYTPIIDFPFL